MENDATSGGVVELPASISLIDEPPPAPVAEEKKTEDVPAQGADEKKAEPVVDTPEQQEAKKQSRRARQNERRAAEKAALETEVRMLREQNAKLEAKPAEESGEPKREAFEDYESYLRAVARYDAAQETAKGLKAERDDRQSKEAQSKQSNGQQKIAEAWEKRETEFIKQTRGYAETVTPYVEEELGDLAQLTRQAIVDSDAGPALLHHLATNSDVHEALANLSPARQVAKLVELEDKLGSKAPPAKTVSDAAPPAKTVSASRSAPSGYSDNMSQAEYEKWRTSQGNRPRWA